MNSPEASQDEARLRELCVRPHLWPAEVDEVLELASRLGVVVTIHHEALDAWAPTEGEGRDD